jgi:hypothetical protein
MPTKWGYLFLIVLFFSACTPPAETVSFPETPTITSTAAPVLTSTATATRQFSTRTPQPSKTPTLVPSATATLDVASIDTRTPAPAQECPTPANVSLPDLSIDPNDFFPTFKPREEEILDYLNEGGDSSKLMSEYKQTWRGLEVFANNEVLQDLTGDSNQEILIIPIAELYIFGCRDGKYEILMSQYSDSVTMNPYLFQLAGTQDMNLNGTPEVVIAEFGCGGMSAAQCLDVYIYEWDGSQFASLIPEGDSFVDAASISGGSTEEYLPGVQIKDTDQNGTVELILTGGIPNSWYDDYFKHAPWRTQSDTYGWDGQHFVLLRTDFSAPVYRYQAVQDGDRAMVRKEYDKALAFYQEAIFSDKLLGWSPAHKERSIALHELTWNFELEGTPTPAIPPDDPQEYPNLAAYARYRIMLLHILQDHLPEAQIVYETLQEKFPEGNDGYGFALIAKAFWDEYQLSKNVKKSCDKAVSMAYKYKLILRFLGGDYHNYQQDIMYESTDVCPFK